MRTQAVVMAQMQMPWHDGGLFMGMHWLWWSIWILTFVVLIWGMVRFFGDRSATHERLDREAVAEEALRRRFAEGEIDEEEFARRLRILRETHGSG